MDIKSMTKTELITLKEDINEELRCRVQTKYNELENDLIELIAKFENATGYCVAVDGGDFTDRGITFIKAMFYPTEEYIEPYA